MQNNSIKNWHQDDRPREKLLTKGIDSLNNAELLAIIINNGTTNKSALDLARELLQKVDNNLFTLSKLSVSELLKLKIKGIGPAKAISIVAALEISNRRETAAFMQKSFTSSKEIGLYLKSILQHKTVEIFWVLYMNNNHVILGEQEISKGGITSTMVDVRVILKHALQYNATKIVLCHNHPSGNLNPSEADKQLTKKIKEASALHEIVVLDHFIVSHTGFKSFAENDLL